jgi:protein-S-isoprenylcysteine O-methyltransferase Ste14
LAGRALLREFPDLPPVWALAAAVLAWVLARLAPLAALPAWPAAPLAVAGAGLMLWAALWFRAKRTPIEPRQPPRALIVEGPFRLNRNPIYSGMVLVLVAWGFFLGAASALLPAAGYLVLVDRRFVRAEEAALRAGFGAEAERYLAATRRW